MVQNKIVGPCHPTRRLTCPGDTTHELLRLRQLRRQPRGDCTESHRDACVVLLAQVAINSTTAISNVHSSFHSCTPHTLPTGSGCALLFLDIINQLLREQSLGLHLRSQGLREWVTAPGGDSTPDLFVQVAECIQGGGQSAPQHVQSGSVGVIFCAHPVGECMRKGYRAQATGRYHLKRHW